MKLWRLLVAIALLLGFGAATCGAQSSAQGVYAVKSGDTLGGILYGLRAQGIDTTNIMRLNPALGMERIYPGEKILYDIPEKPLPSVSQEEMQQEVNKEAQEILNAQNEALAKLSAGQKNIATQESSHFGIIITGLGIAIVLLGVVAWRVSRGQHAVAVVRENVQPEPLLEEPLINPDLPTVRQFAKKYGKTSVRATLVVLGQDFPCTIQIPDQGQLFVHFDQTEICNETRPIGWDRRNQLATKMVRSAQEKLIHRSLAN